MARTELTLLSQPVTLVDTCVLLDLMTDDPHWSPWSSATLAAMGDQGPLVINPIIYAEVSADFASLEELDKALPPLDYRREPLPFAAGFLAGQAFVRYRRRGGAKRSPIADFYIGAHAAVAGYRLLTRDIKRYRTYFADLSLVSPETT